jgi:copper(I)-binding protein
MTRTIIRPGKKALRWLPALLAVGVLAGCSVGDPYQDLPAGGTDADSGQVTVSDLWIDGPQGVAAGASTPLRLALTNQSTTTPDALVGVSTSLTSKVQLEQDGHPVSTIPLPAGGFVDLESTTGVVLEGLHQAVTAGQYYPVTLTFENAGPVTVQAGIAPFAYPEPQDPAATP